jgi:ferritin-like metal-binding protein YciE
VQNVAKQAVVLSKGPRDALRDGRDTQEKMVRNAMDEAMTEGLEIASYDAIESFAKALGDNETATLAADIRADEERMLQDLRGLIPELSKEFAKNSVIELDERAAV